MTPVVQKLLAPGIVLNVIRAIDQWFRDILSREKGEQLKTSPADSTSRGILGGYECFI